MKKICTSAPGYFLLYLMFMLPTYVLPYLGSNSVTVHAMANAAGGRAPGTFAVALTLHVASLLMLCVLAFGRGSLIQKRWLMVFPALAMVFDLIPGLSAIPLVPTVMHLLALILGVSGQAAVPAKLSASKSSA